MAAVKKMAAVEKMAAGEKMAAVAVERRRGRGRGSAPPAGLVSTGT